MAVYQQSFRLDELTVATLGSWTWSVRPSHPTLGAGLLSLRRPAVSLGELTEQEAVALVASIGLIERRTRGAFDATTFNYSVLMLVHPHVHLHVFPRYDGPREFAGRTFVDGDWPNQVQAGLPAPDDVLYAVRDALATGTE